MRGRKKREDTIKRDKVFGIRLTEEEHQVLIKNKKIREDLVRDFRDKLKIFLFN